MKPVGPIPPGFAAIDGELAIAGRKASDLVAEAGRTPLFVYARERFDARVAELRAALPARVGINYAVKANPMPEVVAHMAGLVDGFDIASSGELAICQSVGIDPARISFAGPGKRDDELAAAIAAGVTLIAPARVVSVAGTAGIGSWSAMRTPSRPPVWGRWTTLPAESPHPTLFCWVD